MPIATPTKVIAVALVIVLVGLAYQFKIVASSWYDWPPPKIDSVWVHQFMGNVSSITGTRFVENSSLDNLAKARFYTAVLEPNITHFGASIELPAGTGEVIYYPSGHSPLGFVQGVELDAPKHWSLMASYGFSRYGYFLGEGPVARVSQNCAAPELPGPNVNVTQFYEKYNCNIVWVTSVWLVIDMTK